MHRKKQKHKYQTLNAVYLQAVELWEIFNFLLSAYRYILFFIFMANMHYSYYKKIKLFFNSRIITLLVFFGNLYFVWIEYGCQTGILKTSARTPHLIHRLQVSKYKDVPHHVSSEKCKLNQ